MKKIIQQVLGEVLWLALSLGLTLVIVSLLIRGSFGVETIDIYLHDVVYVINYWHVVLPIFLLVTFLIYFIKEFRKSFSRNLANMFLVIVGFTLVISVTLLTRTISQSFITGWTIYPPLSALGQNDPVVAHDPATKFILNILTFVQVVILSILLLVVYRWGKIKSGKVVNL